MFQRRHARPLALAVSAAALLAPLGGALAQSSGTGSSTLSGFRNGYNATSGEFSNPVNVAPSDGGGNRVIVDGVIQNGSGLFSKQTGGVSNSSGGVGGIGAATAIGNNLQVTVTGDHNTVVVNSSQTNTGAITATTVLNGKVQLDANGG